ncbi:MAG: hypothetical protein DBY45_10275 [Clostridiales bacterium]|nr:MAG: hypothetical protein DBY45_10275 [Clostridiales bacterium]
MQEIPEFTQEELRYMLDYVKSSCTFPWAKPEYPPLIPFNEEDRGDFDKVICYIKSKLQEGPSLK